MNADLSREAHGGAQVSEARRRLAVAWIRVQGEVVRIERG